MILTTPGPVWVIVTETLCQGPILGEWAWEENRPTEYLPVLYATEAEATHALAEFLRDEWEAVADGHKEPEEMGEDYFLLPGQWDGERLTTEAFSWTLDEMREHSGR